MDWEWKKPQSSLGFLFVGPHGGQQNNRPALAAFMTVNRFQTPMLVVATAISGMNGGRDWQEQTAFLKFEDGSKYLEQLTVLVKAHAQAL